MARQITTYEQLIAQYQFGNPPKILGEGGYGKVFLAFDTLRSRQVAIKVSEVKGDGTNYSLLAETEMVRQQIPPHPNIAYYSTCYRLPMGLSQSDYAIIDYYPLGNLRQLWEKQNLSNATKGNLSEQILQGIHHLHTQANGGKGIIHRDLKPANVLIADNPMDGSYIVKIADFGISKSLRSDSGHTSNSFAGGSLHYAAPEQLGGEEQISKNSDLWSWGVLTYQLFTGQLPYELPYLGREETRAARFYTYLAQAGTAPLLYQLPEPYRAAVRAALTFNRQERPQTAAALLQMISHYEEETIIEERLKGGTIEQETIIKPQPNPPNPPPSKQPGPPPIRSGKKATASPYKKIALAVAALAAAAVVAVFLNIGGNGQINTANDNYKRLVSEGDNLFAKEEYTQARSKYEAALALKPQDETAIANLKKCDIILQPQSAAAQKPAAPASTQAKPIDPPAPETQTTTADPFADLMVDIAGGTFAMGSNDGDEADEKPLHDVTVSSFRMSKYEVTQAQWRTVMGSNPPELYNTNCDQCPIERVSWNDIQEFLRKLNQQTGKTYRLPTEAEWEFAARGGNQSKGYKYAGSNDIGAVAWHEDNHKSSKYGDQGTTHPVGTKKANELGLYDMTGNVWEWCSDLYGSDYYANSPHSDPKGASSGTVHVLRGGSWDIRPTICRITNRFSSTAVNHYYDRGFRLVRSQ